MSICEESFNVATYLMASIILSLTTCRASEGSITITSDVSCPQSTIELTCSMTNIASDSLSWAYNGEQGFIRELGYIYSTQHDYPYSLDVSTLEGIVNYTVVNVSYFADVFLFNYTAELVVDFDVVYHNLNYRSLQCGYFAMMASYLFDRELSIEAPLAFGVRRCDLFYSATSPSILQEFVIHTEEPVYNDTTTCQYKSESYLQANVSFGQDHFAQVINTTACMEDGCSISLNGFVDRAGAGDVRVSVVAANTFKATTATPTQIMFSSSFENNFNFTLRRTSDCELLAVCTAREALDLVNCEVTYRRDSSYHSTQQVQRPFNQPFLLNTLEDDRAAYNTEVVFHSRSSKVDVFYHLAGTHFIEEQNLFQLRLVGVTNCSEWIKVDPVLKATDIVQAVVIKLRERCRCDFRAELITNARFRCFPESLTAVTFRGAITTGLSPQATAKEMAVFLKEWTSSGAFLIIQAQHVEVDRSCEVSTACYEESECKQGTSTLVTTGFLSAQSVSNPTEGPRPDVNNTMIGLLVVVSVLAGLLATMLIFVLVREKRSKSKTHEVPQELNETTSIPSKLPVPENSMEDNNHVYEQIRGDFVAAGSEQTYYIEMKAVSTKNSQKDSRPANMELSQCSADRATEPTSTDM